MINDRDCQINQRITPLFANQEGRRILEVIAHDERARSVGIVGSRDATPLGLEWAHRVAYHAAQEEVIVISGGARGVDHRAHTSALDAGGETLAVLGSGLAQINQRERSLAHRGAGLVSPFEEHQSPRRWTFPRRNLEIAALSVVVVVIQATEESGALITAREALRLKKDVWVLSHLPSEKTHRGCLRLIDEGAKPLLSDRTWLKSISSESNESSPRMSSTKSRESQSHMTHLSTPTQQREHSSALWQAASDTPRSLEWLATRASMSYELALLEATSLELEGWLYPIIGVGYQRAYPR